jgi:hypothetical protein
MIEVVSRHDSLFFLVYFGENEMDIMDMRETGLSTGPYLDPLPPL